MGIHKLTKTGFATFAVLVGGLLFGVPMALAAAPSVVGESVSSVTPFEARLEATVNAGEEATECHFQYGTASVTEHEVSCEGQLPLEGGEQGVGVTVKGLASSTPYHYLVVVKNATGEATGTEEGFTTLTPERPVVESESVSAATSSTATLEAQVNPNYQKTAYVFEYAANKALTGAKKAPGSSELEGFGGQTASVTVSGLEPGENYYYRVTATNETGTSDGVTPAQSFTTLPTPATDAPTNVTGTGATFNGHFTLTPQDTRWYFLYARNGTCTGENSTPAIDAGTGTSVVRPEWTVPSPENPGFYGAAAPLYPDSQYGVCFVTSNTFGSQVGPEVQFTTPPTPPTIDSESVPDLTAGEATLQATINPNLQETTYLFEYSAKETGGTLENPTKVNGAATLPAELRELSVSARIAGLTPNTTYYYRAVAENTTPLAEDGPVQTLLTFPNTPTTRGPSAVTTSTANITGMIDPSANGQPAGHETTYYFQYGNDEAYGKQTPEESAGEGPATLAATVPLSGLKAGWTYHYRILAANNDNGTTQLTYGQDQTFTTEPAPPAPPSENEQPPTTPPPAGAAPVGSTFSDLTAIAPIPGPKESGEIVTGAETKTLTNAQKLAKALKACRKAKGNKRASCEKWAHRKYGPKSSKGKRGKV